MARNKYPEITEARILDTATKLFLEKGWEETTVQDIVDELGDITRGAFIITLSQRMILLTLLPLACF